MKRRLYALLLILVLLLSLLGCSAGSRSAEAGRAPETVTNESAGAAGSGEMQMTMDSVAPSAPESAPMEGGSAVSDEAAAGSAQAVADLSEKLIYTANVTVETTQFDQATDAVEQLVERFGGFLESSQLNGDTGYQADGTVRVMNRRAEYAIRIPSERFREALDQAGSLGNVTSSSDRVTNITPQYTDQEARKNSLLTQEKRLLELLEEADSVDTLVALEARLSDVRYEIESIESTLRNWQNQVDYSTIYLSLYEVAAYTPTAPVQRSFGQQLSDAFAGGWRSFAGAMKDLAIFVVSSLPVLLLLAVVAAAAVLLVRARRRRKARKLPQEPPENQP